jgi:hypothetical protein
MFVFSLDGVPPHERFEAWRQHVRSFTTGLDVRMEPAPGDRMGARMAFQTIGELGIMRTAQSLVARYRRGRAEIARSPVSYYSVHLHLAGSGFLCLRERELAITKGDIFVLDTLNEGEMAFPGSSVIWPKSKRNGLPRAWRERIFMVRLFAAMSP